MARQMADAEAAYIAPLMPLARFGRWDEILAAPEPPAELSYAAGMSHYARGLAFTRKGRLEDAKRELATLRTIVTKVPADRKIGNVNVVPDVLGVGVHVLAGELAAASHKNGEAVRELREAVRRQDRLRYMEPPPWYYPVRQSLGAVLLEAGHAREAEAVYREDLRRNPENGWSLFGLATSLRRQGKTKEADAAMERFRTAWRNADVTLVASRF
jgi:tetratricopeptide (TPR) repeat protein